MICEKNGTKTDPPGCKPTTGFGTNQSPKCINEPPEGSTSMTAARMHKGFPVLSTAEFDRLIALPPAENGVRTFNFQGYLVEPISEELFYAESFAANLRSGVRIYAEGEIALNLPEHLSSFLIRGLGSPEHVGFYSVYIKIPADMQEKLGIVCSYGAVFPEDQFLREYGNQVENARRNESELALFPHFNPQEDSGAREKIKAFVLAVARYIEEGLPLVRLQEAMGLVESRLGQSF